ncbi:flagellar basal body rod C-terminal domain-containing protein [Buchnera aphidicola]|uniref:flagellar basal body rod C-terminal domain-containing protein n=1 Tax=Buchnera aphidicola TaxID=9 RepID=UPI0031B87EFE
MKNKIYSNIDFANKMFEDQEMINNNLANLSTKGFKSKFNYFVKIYDKKNKNIDNKTINYYDNSLGQFNSTNKPLDLAICDKDGWFETKTKKLNTYLTRNGNIKINKDHYLVINNNFLLNTHNKPIYIPKNFLPKIKSDGTIIINYKKNKNYKKNIIGKIKLQKININKLDEIYNGMFKIKNKHYKKNYNEKNNIKIKTGVLEESNVNPISNIINIIYKSRIFETIMKTISVQNENEKRINQILNINN